MDYNMLDFLKADINVTDILNVWRTRTDNWGRPQKTPREVNGLVYVLEGTAQYDFGGTAFTARKGDVLRLPQNIPYSGRKTGSGCNDFYVIDFKTREKEEFLNFPLPFSFLPQNKEYILALFRDLEKITLNQSVGAKLLAKAKFIELLTVLLNDYSKMVCKSTNKDIISYTEYINNNFWNNEFKISDMARHFCISETHLRRLFLSQLNLTPSKYLSDIRLKKSKSLLIYRKELSIEEISFMCGYSSVYYFSDSFKKHTGITPTAYRNKNKYRTEI